MSLIELHPDFRTLSRHLDRIATALESLLKHQYGILPSPSPETTPEVAPEILYHDPELAYLDELRHPDRYTVHGDPQPDDSMGDLTDVLNEDHPAQPGTPRGKTRSFPD